jgi:flavin reductase (DIM6/NTAB) family NADH-FMN oxidoreductase RutF
METPSSQESIITLDPEQPFWDRFHMVAPLVVIGTMDEEGNPNLAPKHMATPMSWRDYFGFVCTPRHKTLRNAKHTGVFTVSYPRPTQVVMTSLAASPREDVPDGPATKSGLDQLPTRPAEIVEGVFLEDAYLFLECEVDQIVDGLGENSLIIGKVAAVHAHEDILRLSDQDMETTRQEQPLLAYIPPDRYATINETHAFPFPSGFSK